MPGASSSAVHELVVETRDDHVHRLVLRRFTNAEWLAREPDLATREAAALELLEAAPLATPRLIAVDATGAHCDVPAVLQSKLPGRPVRTPGDVDRFVTHLVEPLPVVQSVAVAATSAIPDYRPYYLEQARHGELHPPPRSLVPDAWERAIEVHAGPPPVGRRVFLHRDYHPGNVLWRAGRITGVVDWVNASRGPADADLGHCRLNLALDFSADAADRFLAAYRALTGERDYHPYWDIVAAVGMLPEREKCDESADDFVARAVANL